MGEDLSTVLEQELEQVNEVRFEDPLKKVVKDEGEGGVLRETMKCRFPGPPNRYGIHPGYMWDGVDRGNGFERRYLQMMNESNDKDRKEYLDHAKHL